MELSALPTEYIILSPFPIPGFKSCIPLWNVPVPDALNATNGVPPVFEPLTNKEPVIVWFPMNILEPVVANFAMFVVDITSIWEEPLTILLPFVS